MRRRGKAKTAAGGDSWLLVQQGLARPTVTTLALLADHLGVALLDVGTYPEDDDRQELVDATRRLTKGTVRRLLREAAGTGRRSKSSG